MGLNELCAIGSMVSLLTGIIYILAEPMYVDLTDRELGRDIYIWWSDLTGLIASVLCLFYSTKIAPPITAFPILTPAIVFGCHIWFKNSMAWYKYLRHTKELSIMYILLEAAVYLFTLIIIYAIGGYFWVTLLFLTSGLIVYYFFLPFHRKIKFKKYRFESVCSLEDVQDRPLLVLPREWKYLAHLELYSFIVSKRRLTEQIKHLNNRYSSYNYKYKFAKLAYEYFMSKFEQ